LNSRLDEIQAAVLRVKLPRLDADNQRRWEIAQYYLEHISNPDIILPRVPWNTEHVERSTEAVTPAPAAARDRLTSFASMPYALYNVWHLFVVRHQKRDRLQQYLTDNGIQTLIHYPIPPHKQSAYREWNKLSLPITEKMHEEVLSLPISQVMEETAAMKVTEIINKFK